jgi:protease II
MVRGTKYIDHNWYLEGSNQFKFKQILDLIDISVFLKEKEITPALGLYSNTPGSGLVALAAI